MRDRCFSIILWMTAGNKSSLYEQKNPISHPISVADGSNCSCLRARESGHHLHLPFRATEGKPADGRYPFQPFCPACQPAALGDTHPRLGIGVARPSLVGNPRKRFVDIVVVERQGQAVRSVGSDAGSALLYRQGEARLSGRDVQGWRVQLQALRNRQAGRPDQRAGRAT